MKENYQLLTDQQLNIVKQSGHKPTLLLHACCAPCSSYVLEYLDQYFDITIYFYNPNISPKAEFDFRLNELKRLVSEMPLSQKIDIIEGDYDNDSFLAIASGREAEKEGGNRCKDCYTQRLRSTYEVAQKNGFEYFTTTLSISPYKNAEWINEIGKNLSQEGDVKWLFSDFKKRNGYKRSCELSAIYSLYRQNYCGCVFSKRQSEEK